MEHPSQSESLWYKNAIFYEVYVRAFHDSNGDGHGDIPGLTKKLDYLQELGVDCLWLLPIYHSPLLDDGYDIADFTSVHPDYGTLQDLKNLIDAAHQRGMRIILDLVLNHTSDQHPWFQSARRDPASPYRDYYVWSDDDQKYNQTRIIFLDTVRSNWTWDDQARQYFWHRFYSSQPDLNYDNPAVQQEIFQVVDFWLNMGVDGFRADAVPYLFEREGTNCENLPETHLFLKKLRRFIDERHPNCVLLCEANQWPQDVRPYFGTGDEFHMGFHFPLMPRIFMALRRGEISPIVWALENTPPIPRTCQWCIFLRNHDELTLEMVTDQERQWMWEQYAPHERMRLNLGIRRRLAPLLDNDQELIQLAYSLLFSLPGSPIIYYGDEIGMGDDIRLPDRNGVRTPMQWNSDPQAGFSTVPPEKFFAPLITQGDFSHRLINVESQEAQPNSMLNWIRRTLKVRKTHPAFGFGGFRLLPVQNPSLLAYYREYEDETLLILNNLSKSPQIVHLESSSIATRKIIDLLGDQPPFILNSEVFQLELNPLEYRWYKLEISEE